MNCNVFYVEKRGQKERMLMLNWVVKQAPHIMAHKRFIELNTQRCRFCLETLSFVVWRQLLARREMFSESFRIKPKSDCIYYFSIVLKQTEFRLVANESEIGKYNLISVRFEKISKIFVCV